MTHSAAQIKEEIIESIEEIINNSSDKKLQHTTEITDFKFFLALEPNGIFSYTVDKVDHGNPVFLRHHDESILQANKWHDFTFTVLADILDKNKVK